MDVFQELDTLLRNQSATTGIHDDDSDSVYVYAAAMASIENAVVVVSDMLRGKSRIFAGEFGNELGLEEYNSEDSIWEHKILAMLPDEEMAEKVLAELRFFRFLRKIPKARRTRYCLMSSLRFRSQEGRLCDMLHKMYYVYAAGQPGIVRFAICIYGPLSCKLPYRSAAVDTVTGTSEALTSEVSDLLTSRQRQVLTLIDGGMTSAEIAERLCISLHTVSRHRQEILAALQVRNSVQACFRAKALGII